MIKMSFFQGERKLLFFQFPDVMPIRPPPNNQDEPMTTEGTSSEQAATSEKVGFYFECGVADHTKWSLDLGTSFTARFFQL